MKFLAYIKDIITTITSDNAGNTAIVVPVLMTIISGVAVASSDNFNDILAEARDTRRAADAYQVSTALAMYYDEHGEYPLVSEDDTAAWEELRAELEPHYIQELPNDPAIEYNYDYESEDGQFAKVVYYSEIAHENKERWSY